MIKNIIFDLAGVLIDVNSRSYLEAVIMNNSNIDILIKLIWGGTEICEADKGLLDYNQFIDKICVNNPKYSNQLRYVLNHRRSDLLINENPENCKYFMELKKSGFNIYFLSNVTRFDLEYLKSNCKIFNEIDGAVYSCESGFTKPQKGIYNLLLNKYKLLPEESIFIDDRLENCKTSEELGIHTILFKDLEQLKYELKAICTANNTSN